MQLSFTCRNCGQVVPLEGEVIVEEIDCPHCGMPNGLPSNFLEPSTQLSGYEVGRLIHLGSESCIYVGEQMAMKRPVAIKVLRPAISENKDHLDRYLAKVRRLGKIDYPTIVKVYETSAVKNVCFVAMALVDGVTLESRVADMGLMQPAPACTVVLKLARALKHAWKNHELAHGAINPRNVVFDLEDNEPRLLNFGVADFTDDPGNDMCFLGRLGGYLLTADWYEDEAEAVAGLQKQKKMPSEVVTLISNMIKVEFETWGEVVDAIEETIGDISNFGKSKRRRGKGGGEDIFFELDIDEDDEDAPRRSPSERTPRRRSGIGRRLVWCFAGLAVCALAGLAIRRYGIGSNDVPKDDQSKGEIATTGRDEITEDAIFDQDESVVVDEEDSTEEPVFLQGGAAARQTISEDNVVSIDPVEDQHAPQATADEILSEKPKAPTIEPELEAKFGFLLNVETKADAGNDIMHDEVHQLLMNRRNRAAKKPKGDVTEVTPAVHEAMICLKAKAIKQLAADDLVGAVDTYEKFDGPEAEVTAELRNKIVFRLRTKLADERVTKEDTESLYHRLAELITGTEANDLDVFVETKMADPILSYHPEVATALAWGMALPTLEERIAGSFRTDVGREIYVELTKGKQKLEIVKVERDQVSAVRLVKIAQSVGRFPRTFKASELRYVDRVKRVADGQDDFHFFLRGLVALSAQQAAAAEAEFGRIGHPLGAALVWALQNR